MATQAVLFDIDGTLIDSNDQHVLAWVEAFSTIGAAFKPHVIHQQIGKGADMLVPTLIPDADEDLCDRLSEAHGKVFKRDFLAHVLPFPGARELLARVRNAGQKVVLASSASEAELEHYLDLLNARGLVSATTSADDVEHTKPAPDIFATALGKVAPLGPRDVAVIGDTPYDMEAARKCGIEPIGVRSGGFSDADLIGAGCTILYDDVASLLDGFEKSPLYS